MDEENQSDKQQHWRPSQLNNDNTLGEEEEDMFFASGPFYTHLDDDHSMDKEPGHGSKCNVVYTEMPTTSNHKRFSNSSAVAQHHCDTLCCVMQPNGQSSVSPSRKGASHRNSSIRVIKPMAIKAEIDEAHHLRDRPSTSASTYPSLPSESLSSNSSAFRQVPRKPHCRSNSLCESFVFRPGCGKGDDIYVESKSPKGEKEEPIHMTLEEVRRVAFRNSNHDNCDSSPDEDDIDSLFRHYRSHFEGSSQTATTNTNTQPDRSHKSKIKLLIDNILNKTHCIGANTDRDHHHHFTPAGSKIKTGKKCDVHANLKGYRLVKLDTTTDDEEADEGGRRSQSPSQHTGTQSSPFIRRALPPLPSTRNGRQRGNQPNLSSETTPQDTSLNTQSATPAAPLRSMTDEEKQKFLDYASSIERVKHCGWYWGPISGEMAEKLLETEPCGSFLVRDSSDEHYIFSLTFKLDGLVRHVRIEHDQGNFSFGTLQKFRSTTIVDFIESAVEHSRSGRFLFFLHRRPVMGPIRVQLLHPVSRFKKVQSLQHYCRFAILRCVRRDQIKNLPLPDCIRSYLDTPYYYSEELANMMNSMTVEGRRTTQRLEQEKRKFFGQIDNKTFLEKMLINVEEVERKLSIKLRQKEDLSNLELFTASTDDEELL